MARNGRGTGMKRYKIVMLKGQDDWTYKPLDCSNGEWVKYDDVKKLEELNREIAKVLRRVCEVGCLYKRESVPNLCGNCIIGVALKEDIAGLQSLWKAEEGYDEWTNQLPSEEDWGEEDWGDGE
jgi:hypothetical protein